MNLTQSLGLLFGKGTGLFHTVKLENDNLSIFTASACIRCQVPFSSKLYHPCLTKACVYIKFARTNATPWSLQEISGSTWGCDCHLLVKEALSFLQM